MKVIVSTQFERKGVINMGDLPPELELNTEHEPLVPITQSAWQGLSFQQCELQL
jgi:hypothetical protein